MRVVDEERAVGPVRSADMVDALHSVPIEAPRGRRRSAWHARRLRLPAGVLLAGGFFPLALEPVGRI